MRKIMASLMAAAFCLLSACGQTDTAAKPDSTPAVQDNADTDAALVCWFISSPENHCVPCNGLVP